MAGNGSGFEDDDPLLAPGCYSQLLFSAEEIQTDINGCFDFTSFSSSNNSDDIHDSNYKSPKMLCFADYANNSKNVGVDNSGQKSGPTCNTTKISTTLPKSNKKRDGSGGERVRDPDLGGGAPVGSQRSSTKKSKCENSTVTGGGHAKVAKKEKLGERIAALQQLVSPFGKTDTASVLHEAFGYIRFLQDQVQVLCSPYLQCPPPSSVAPHSPGNGKDNEIERRKDDLRSRGLCLVPVELTLHVADSNGADLWSSSAMVNNVSSA